MGEFSECGDSPQKREASPSAVSLYAGAAAVESFSLDIALPGLSDKCFVGYDLWGGHDTQRLAAGAGRSGVRRDARPVRLCTPVANAGTSLGLARAEAHGGLEGHAVLCSSMAETDAGQPAKSPVQIVHDCLSCCLGSLVGVLGAPAELPTAARFSLPIASLAPTLVILPEQAGSPPPQRAPPSFA